MKPLSLIFLGCVLGLVGCAHASAAVTYDYGQRAKFTYGAFFIPPKILLFPDFAVRLGRFDTRVSGYASWLTHEFEILDRQTLVKQGSFSFTMGGVYDNPDFTFAGKRYAVEMYWTTSGPPGPTRKMDKRELIIWSADLADLYRWIWQQNRGMPLTTTPETKPVGSTSPALP